MKKLFKVILFILIFLLILSLLWKILIRKGDGFGSDVYSFYSLEDNSLDIVFFGSSHCYSTFSPYVIEEKTGLKSYNFSTQQQPINITYHFMVETLKTQKPAYFVLETRMFAVDDEYMEEGVVRDALDKMKMSPNKIEAINESVENPEDRTSYYFNIIKYHSRFMEIGVEEIMNAIKGKSIDNNGFVGLPSSQDVYIDNTNALSISETTDLSNKNLEFFNKIIDLCKQNNITLILTKSPCILTDDDQKHYNKVKEIAEENHIRYIDYNYMFDELDFTFPDDFYDYGHLSKSGAEKVTTNFSNFIYQFKKS